MSPSRWPRSPSHGKCSRKFCALSRNCGLSHHQRQHETFDSHAFKSKPREGVCTNVNEDGQIRPSTSFGEPAMPGAIHASHSCFQVIQKSATVHVRPRFIRGIPVDLYETPPCATRALLHFERAHMPRRIWEPACGPG